MSASAKSVLAGLRVLVVDDHQDGLDLLVIALENEGAEVFAASSARKALDVLLGDRVDVIVSDIAMPGVDGYELMRSIRALPGTAGRTPAIALTAFARNDDRDDALGVGFQRHITKPIDVNELVAIVAETATRA